VEQTQKNQTNIPRSITFDAIMPSEMALRAEARGVKRAATDPLTVMVLSVLAGAFISLGGSSIGKTPADYPTLTWSNFLFANLIPVTIGNITGGTVMVAAVYWFVYLRPSHTRR
jgi:formate/nitrite transporter FocA (FNT family)